MSQTNKDLSFVTAEDLSRVSDNAEALNEKAMLLTDAWGGVMFILDSATVINTVTTLGLSQNLGQRFYDKVRSVSVIDTWGLKNPPPNSRVFTWHMLAAAILTVRGEKDLGQSLSWLNNNTLQSYVRENSAYLQRIFDVQPDYSSYLLFSPKVASDVVGVFGARVDADVMLRVAKDFGIVAALDPEGRHGIACKFARSLTLSVAAKGAAVGLITSKAA